MTDTSTIGSTAGSAAGPGTDAAGTAAAATPAGTVLPAGTGPAGGSGTDVPLDLVHLAWQAGEPVHALIYFHPRSREFSDATGFRGFWMGYFGFRSAPFGPASADLVTATFYNFAPRMVARSIPDAWRFAAPEKALAGRLAAVDAALRDVLEPRPDGGAAAGPGPDGGRAAGIAGEVEGGVEGEAVRRAAELACRAAASAVTAGRPLGAANAGLPVPDEPHLALWQALTTLREHRGDGHIAALLRREVGPCEALVLAAATGRSSPDLLRAVRGWTEQEWADAVASLAARGWVDAAGNCTEEGRRVRAEIEAETDVLAAQPYRVLGAEGLRELTGLLCRLSDAVVARGAFLQENPIGLNWPPEPQPQASEAQP